MKSSYRSSKKILALILMIIGILLMSHMFYSWIYMDFKSKDDISSFKKSMSELSSKEKKEKLKLAEDYEKTLDPNGGSIVDPFEVEDYDGIIKSIEDDGAFSYLIIPKLNVHRPVFLGASERNMLRGVAQVEGTSLPVGGVGKRSVIAGHRGAFRSGEMFLYLDKLMPGDRIYLYSLGDRLVYEVFDREVILPSENEKLLPVKDEDIITLLTCHPFPVNNKRLLVNCRRVSENKLKANESYDESYEAVDGTVKFAKNASLILAAVFTVILIVLIIRLIIEIRKPKHL